MCAALYVCSHFGDSIATDMSTVGKIFKALDKNVKALDKNVNTVEILHIANFLNF